MSAKPKSILRREKRKEDPYTRIANSVIRDKSISFRARGLLVYILSMPDDWTIYTSELERHSDHDGRESIATAMDELREHGYITRDQERNEKGQITAWIYMVHEEPVEVDADVLLAIEKKREAKKVRDQRKQQRKIERLVQSQPETGTPHLDEAEQKPETVSPHLETPHLATPQLLNTKSTNDLLKLTTDLKTHTAQSDKPEAQAPVCVADAIMVKAQESLGIAPTKYGEGEIQEWLTKHTEADIIEQIDIIKDQGSTTPLRSLRAAMKRPWSRNEGNVSGNQKESNTSESMMPERVVPAVQPGKYERFYQVYRKNTSR